MLAPHVTHSFQGCMTKIWTKLPFGSQGKNSSLLKSMQRKLDTKIYDVTEIDHQNVSRRRVQTDTNSPEQKIQI
jgi:hypothetical protein